MSLADLQSLFLAAIRYPTGVSDFLAQASPEIRAQFERAFVSSPGFDATARLGVYAESYFWRLADVLGDQYRVVAWLCGRRRFHNLVTDYVWQRPSQSPDLRRYGRDLPDFIAAHAIAAEIAGIEQLARVERSIVAAIDMPDEPTIGPDTLAAIEVERWPAMRLRAASWVKLWATQRSYPALFERRRKEEPSPDPMPPPDGRNHHVLVWRQDIEVCHRSVPADEARALSAMLAGDSFEQICLAAATPAAGSATPAADPAAVVQWLRAWLSAGLVVAVT